MATGQLKKASESEQARAIRQAIGSGPNEPVSAMTPQFERTAREPVPAAPPTDWEALRSLSKTALKELGLCVWNNPAEDDDKFEGMVLMLFPSEWYSSIPGGFIVTDIFNRDKAFVRGVTDDNIRHGCLAYGIKVQP